jgi:hypothetical protein
MSRLPVYDDHKEETTGNNQKQSNRMNRKVIALRLIWEAQKGRLKASFPKLSDQELESMKPKKMIQAELDLHNLDD